jgi:peptidoglycan/LPS O-acetylase OafA/YrhL
MIGGAVIVGTALWGGVPSAYLHSGVMLPAIVAVVRGLADSRPSVLATAPFVALGRASYATYICHVPRFLLAARIIPALWRSLSAVVVYGAVPLVLSLAVHRFVEEPLPEMDRPTARQDAGPGDRLTDRRPE